MDKIVKMIKSKVPESCSGLFGGQILAGRIELPLSYM